MRLSKQTTLRISTLIQKTILVLAIFATSLSALASDKTEGHDEGHGHSEEKFNAGEMIIHHLGSTHDIHLWGHTSIPLPVILYTDRGVDMFMSNKFWDADHHANASYTSEKTGYTYVDHHNFIEIVAVDGNPVGDEVHDLKEKMKSPDYKVSDSDQALLKQTKLIDFSITKSIFGMLLIMAIMLIIFIRAARRYGKNPGKAPRGIQNLVETLVVFVRDDIIVPAIGEKKAPKFTPFLLSAFFFIWLSNLLGLIPFIGGFNITGTIWITLVLATMVFVITTINGNKHYWGHIFNPPGVPFAIKIILVVIEFVQVFMKPIVLFIRLTANIAAGHIIILAFVSLIIIFGEINQGVGYGVAVGSVAFMILMFVIELLVAFLQAYVFTLLAALYFGDATQEAHH